MWSPELQSSYSSKENASIMENCAHGKWYGTPSMPRRKAGSPRESPRLSLEMFAKTPRVSFGKVKIGNSKIKRVIIENPSSIAQSLYLDKLPEKKGFTVLTPVEHGSEPVRSSDGSFEALPRCADFTVPAMSDMDLPILWRPEAEGNFRETITLKLGDINRLMLILFGIAIDTTVKSKSKSKMKTLLPEDIKKASLLSQKRKKSSVGVLNHETSPPKKVLQESNTGVPVPKNPPSAFDISATMPVKKKGKKITESKTKTRTFKGKVSSKGVAQARLSLVKKKMEESRNIPRHPLPFAAKNVYFDEKWIEKQERGFVQWLNYVLTPPDELTTLVVPESSSIFVMDESQPLAPTKEVLSMQAYTARRKMARLRRCACLLYQSAPVALVARTVESEVEKNRLCIRSDKHFHQDLGIKETILNMLLSYNSLWLRIGLETVYGELLPLHSNNDISGLKRFLKTRFLANPDIAKEYRHATVAEYYRKGYYEALTKFTLKKFLLLVLFLDKAKLTRLIDHDPCLFNKDAKFKCNRDLLLTFSRDYLKGEGDVTKHLSFLNYTVNHAQAPLDEMDYAIKNLAVDLRDGLRITRVIELLTQNWTLSSQLRAPAISRLQKIHNVEVALDALKERGVFEDDCVNPRHIVDGHREKTLSFLWLIILHFQVNLVVNETQLRDEICFLQKYHRLTKPAQQQKYWDEHDVYAKSDKLRLLLDWCRAVCRLYDVTVENFTVSMSDGRVLCYLVHYYHPCLLREEDICQETTQTCNPYAASEDESEDDSFIKENWIFSHDKGYGGSRRLKELKENERKNHELCRKKVQELGGVPCMLKFTDMSSTIPDEKVVVTYVSYLCARLLDLKDEGRAARIIQVTWRRYLQEKQAKELQRKTKAAEVLQKHVRLFLEKKRCEVLVRSVLVIQSCYRGYRARRDVMRCHCAAAVIQTSYRSYKNMKETRRHYQALRKATLTMQALVRGKICRQLVVKIKAARVLQSYWRKHLARRHFLSLRKSMVAIQAKVRTYQARRKYVGLRMASVAMQRRYRSLRIARDTRDRYRALRDAVITMQARRRGIVGRREVSRLRAVVILQASLRMWSTRRQFSKTRERIVHVQSVVRRNIARKRYKECISSARIIQTRWRAYKLGRNQRCEYQELRSAAVTVQALWRCIVVRRDFLTRKQAAVVLQATIRGFLVRTKVEQWSEACSVIQKYFRGYLLTKQIAAEYQRKREAVVKLQAFHRARVTRLQYLRTKKAVISLQALLRARLARGHFLMLRAATILLQTRYRGLTVMRSERDAYVRTRDHTVTLQACWRGYCVRRHLKTMNEAATHVQAVYRGHVARAHYLCIQRSVQVIQTRYRAWLVARQLARDYARLRHAAVIMQKYTRGFRVRKEMKVKAVAAVVIQARYRGYQAKQRYSRLREAALTVQLRYRALRMSRATRDQYLVKRASVVKLQSALRQFLCVRNLQRLKAAVRVLESRWRALVVGRQETENYQRIRGSVLTIQAFVRGMRARRRVRRERAAILVQACWRATLQRRSYLATHDATVKIQACYRMWNDRRKFVMLKDSVTYLQKLVRANQASRRQTIIYGITRGAVITLQAAVRGYLARQRHHTMRRSAIVIQSSLRRHIVRRRYLQLRYACIVMQQQRRALVTGRHAQTEYRHVRRSVILLQSFVRARKMRREFKDSCRKLTLLQATVRGFLARSRYLRMRQAAVVIQERYRAYRESCAVYFWYNVQRGACITLQAHTRAWLCRRRYLGIKNAAHVIQLYHRATSVAKKQRQQYLDIRSATITIQAFTRGWMTRRHVMRSRAATYVQSWWRMTIVRREYSLHRRYAVVLQAWVRMLSCRRRYEAMRQATVTVQRRWRATQLCMKERDVFLEKKGSCLFIQHSYRYYRQRRLVATMLRRVAELRNATLVVQRRYRANRVMDEARRKYLITRGAIITLQAGLRAFLARNFVTQVRAAIFVQSCYRRHRQRSEYTKLRCAVIKLQALIRGKQICEGYQELRAASVVLQRRERARVQGLVQRRVFLMQRAAAILIQSYVRGYQERCRYQALKKAAVKMQALQRAKQGRSRYARMRNAVVLIQRRYRATVLGGIQRHQFLRLKRSAVIIQSWLRGNAERKQYTCLKNNVVKMQALVRGKHACVAFKRLHDAAMVVQRRMRAKTLGERERSVFLEQKRCAVLIQSHVRGWQARRGYQAQRDVIVMIQAWVKSHQQRKRYVTMVSAAVRIQQHYRALRLGRTAASQYQELRSAAILVQSIHRGNCCRKFVKRVRSTITIQAAWRRHISRSWYLDLKKTAVYIQATQRMRRERQKYNELIDVTVKMQRRVSANQLCRRETTNYNNVRSNVIKLQALYRGWRAREHVRRIRAAHVIQRHYRACLQGRCARIGFVRIRMAAITVQAWHRGHMTRKHFKRARAARVIQAYVRGRQVRKHVEKLRKEKAAKLHRFSAAIFIHLMACRLQRAYRRACAIAAAKARMDKLLFLQRWWRAKTQRLYFLRVKHLVCVVQRIWRRHLAVKHQAATKIQACVRMAIARRNTARRKEAILTIQAFWRGSVVRKQCKSKKIKKARERIEIANSRVTEAMKLCNRTRSALDYLLKCKNLTTVLGALVNLEVASRLSKRCTEQLVADHALSVIFKVVRNTNRSLAHIELIKHAIAIFINVAKCPTTKTAVVDREPNSLDTLVELACIFRENVDIFPNTCHLLTTLSQDEHIRQELLNTEKAVTKLTSAYNLTKRKHDRDVKRNEAARRRSSISLLSSRVNKKKLHCSLSPLTAITALVHTLGLLVA